VIKFSLGTWAFSFGPFAAAPWPLDRVLAYCAEVGFDGIELNGFRPHAHQDDLTTVAKVRALRDRIADYGLGLSGYAPSLEAVPPALVDTPAYLAEIRKCLFICQHLGTNVLRVDTGSPPVALAPEEYERRMARLIGTWRAAAEEVQRAGVRIVWEFEPGFWLNKPSEVLRVAQSVGHESFGVLFDTSHAYMGAVIGARQTGARETLPGGVVEYAQMLTPHIGHLHLIDSDGTLHHEETSTHTPFGEGYIDFCRVLQVIHSVAAGMEWWCADFCFCAETERAGRQAVPFMRQLAEEVL
jgi:sugar phosphate isomerase/epimerase